MVSGTSMSMCMSMCTIYVYENEVLVYYNISSFNDYKAYPLSHDVIS